MNFKGPILSESGSASGSAPDRNVTLAGDLRLYSRFLAGLRSLSLARRWTLEEARAEVERDARAARGEILPGDRARRLRLPALAVRPAAGARRLLVRRPARRGRRRAARRRAPRLCARPGSTSASRSSRATSRSCAARSRSPCAPPTSTIRSSPERTRCRAAARPAPARAPGSISITSRPPRRGCCSASTPTAWPARRTRSGAARCPPLPGSTRPCAWRAWATRPSAGSATSRRADLGGLFYRSATPAIVAFSRLCRTSLPFPELVPLRASRADRALGARRRGSRGGARRAAIGTTISQAVRVAAAAVGAGIDLSGVTFVVGGEPVTAAKVAALERAARATSPPTTSSRPAPSARLRESGRRQRPPSGEPTSSRSSSSRARCRARRRRCRRSTSRP